MSFLNLRCGGNDGHFMKCMSTGKQSVEKHPPLLDGTIPPGGLREAQTEGEKMWRKRQWACRARARSLIYKQLCDTIVK